MIISMFSPIRFFQQHPTVDCGDTNNLAIEMYVFRFDFLGNCFNVFFAVSSALTRTGQVELTIPLQL